MTTVVNEEKNYEALAAAIIRQAVKDYEKGRELTRRRIEKSKGYIEGMRLIDDTKRFFHSQWFTQLSKADGPAMFRKIEENYNKYGECMPFVKEKEE